jgi:hypothetical protein
VPPPGGTLHRLFQSSIPSSSEKYGGATCRRRAAHFTDFSNHPCPIIDARPIHRNKNPCSKNNTGQTFVICDPKILGASLKYGIVKLYSDLDDWRVDGGLKDALASVREQPLGLWASLPLGDTTSSCVVVEDKCFDALCKHLDSLPRNLNVSVRLAGVYDAP